MVYAAYSFISPSPSSLLFLLSLFHTFPFFFFLLFFLHTSFDGLIQDDTEQITSKNNNDKPSGPTFIP